MDYILSGKFRKSANTSDIVIGGQFRHSFPQEIDTQSFAQCGDVLAVVHHQFHKIDGTPPIEFFNGGHNVRLPDEHEIKFPTSVASKDNLLAVAVNGAEFKGSIRVYKKDGSEFKSLAVLNLSDGQERPVGLVFDDDKILWASYSGQKIWCWDFMNNSVSLIVDVAKYGQTTPIGILPLGDTIAVVGHVDGSLVFYERKYGLPVRIIRDKLCYPWGITSEGDDIIIGNRGDELTGSYILKLSEFGEELERISSDGVTVVRS